MSGRTIGTHSLTVALSTVSVYLCAVGTREGRSQEVITQTVIARSVPGQTIAVGWEGVSTNLALSGQGQRV